MVEYESSFGSCFTVHDLLDILKANPEKWFCNKDFKKFHTRGISKKLRSLITHGCIDVDYRQDPVNLSTRTYISYKQGE